MLNNSQPADRWYYCKRKWLKRWPTLYKYFRVKLFWKKENKKQKQKQTNGTNCLSFDEIFFRINNVIHCERILLKRWPTLFRYFRVKLLKKKTETNKRNELLNIWWNFLPVKECCFVQKQRTSKKFGPIINPMGLSN